MNPSSSFFWFDVHAHPFDSSLKHLPDDVLTIVAGYDEISNETIVEKQYAFFTLGFAPQSLQLNRDWEKAQQQIVMHASKIVGIGEIGLDYKWAQTQEQRQRQKQVFEQALELAERLQKNVVIHSRKAEDDVISVLSAYNVKAILHAFGGNAQQAKKAYDDGHLISIPPMRSKDRRAVIKTTPITHLVIETDFPYIGKKVYDIKKAAQYIAEVKNMDVEEVRQTTAHNAAQFFSLPL
jgi:TatD DNase family protein